MYMNIEERKRIQTVLEGAVNVADNNTEKNFFLQMLSLIYELNDKDGAISAYRKSEYCNADGVCFLQLIQSLIDDFTSPDALENVDEDYLKYFTTMAGNLVRLSAKVNELHEVLTRLHDERNLTKAANTCVVQ